MKKVVVTRSRTQIQRAVFEFGDDAEDKEAQAIALYQRSSEDPFTGRSPWAYAVEGQ